MLTARIFVLRAINRPAGVSPISDVEVKTSSIEGLGIFAAQSFCTGQRIRQINVVREVTSTSPLREELGERADHCDYPNGKVVLLGPPDRYVNHSCDPNAYVLYECDGCFLVARRDIVVGEEITCDYNVSQNGIRQMCNRQQYRCCKHGCISAMEDPQQAQEEEIQEEKLLQKGPDRIAPEALDESGGIRRQVQCQQFSGQDDGDR